MPVLALPPPGSVYHGAGFGSSKPVYVKEVPDLNPELWEQRALAAPPGIQAALAVLLGVKFAKQAHRFAELCGRDLNKAYAIITQAGYHVTAADAPVVELLFAAAVNRHGKTACRMSEHTRCRKSNWKVMLEEDLRWRSDAGGVRRSCPSPQPPTGHGKQVATGPLLPAKAAKAGETAHALPGVLCSTHMLGVKE
eukprot:TRINITY_DN8985_c0_g1_i2.p1 TRINITY_DN8985_c0_g1~~TRINITY_DN8985_c0_g1_i2.p1  ORF type:complete len:195 (+),score=38.00 TRINITY_DN8985_c0_g1_i2:13-597(+)